jgi:hypothetical protein
MSGLQAPPLYFTEIRTVVKAENYRNENRKGNNIEISE